MNYFEERFSPVKLWFVLQTIMLHSSQTKSASDPGYGIFLSHIG